MADFCRQCTWESWGTDDSDFEYLGDGAPPLRPGYGYSVLCEGCGFTLVDGNGNCIQSNCLMKGHKKYASRNLPPVQSEPDR